MGWSRKFETITAAEAARYFAERWPHNAALDEERVAKYAAKMATGKWTREYPSDQPLTFNGEGQLVNGQHRMCAAARANYTGEYYVKRRI